MLREFPVLRNVVDARNTVSIRWLVWLGFTIGTPQPMGVRGLPFIPFANERAMMIVEACPIADIVAAAAFPQLAAEYVRESLIDGMPQPAPDWNAYAALEAAGLLHGFAASVDGELVGFIAVLRAKLPRYAEPIAVSESFFVATAHRGTGAGLKLLRAAEDKARAARLPRPAGERAGRGRPRAGAAAPRLRRDQPRVLQGADRCVTPRLRSGQAPRLRSGQA